MRDSRRTNVDAVSTPLPDNEDDHRDDRDDERDDELARSPSDGGAIEESSDWQVNGRNEREDTDRIERLPPALARRTLVSWQRLHFAEETERSERLDQDGNGHSPEDPPPAAQEENAGEEATERLAERGREVEAENWRLSARPVRCCEWATSDAQGEGPLLRGVVLVEVDDDPHGCDKWRAVVRAQPQVDSDARLTRRLQEGSRNACDAIED